MDEYLINDLLKKIGMKFFVDYYQVLINNYHSTDKIIEIVLKEHEDYSIKAIKTRISKSRKIFNAGMGKEALLQILKADKIEFHTKEKIEEILKVP